MSSENGARATTKKTQAHGIQSPLPYAFSRRDEFLRLAPEKRTAHLWEAYAFCEKHLDGKRYSQDELQRNLRVLRRMMLQVAKTMAKSLREDGTWKDAGDPRWPRNHKGADVDHWYDSGAFPPQFLALPEDPTSWRKVLAEEPEALFDEMIAWVETPAGQAGVGDEELQKLLADRDTYLPSHTRSLPEETPELPCWHGEEGDRSAGLEWLAAKSGDGALHSWAERFKLPSVVTFLGGVSSNRRPIDQLLPELLKLESSGELEMLQRNLDVDSPGDAAGLAKLRASLPPAS